MRWSAWVVVPVGILAFVTARTGVPLTLGGGASAEPVKVVRSCESLADDLNEINIQLTSSVETAFAVYISQPWLAADAALNTKTTATRARRLIRRSRCENAVATLLASRYKVIKEKALTAYSTQVKSHYLPGEMIQDIRSSLHTCIEEVDTALENFEAGATNWVGIPADPEKKEVLATR